MFFSAAGVSAKSANVVMEFERGSFIVTGREFGKRE